MESFYNNTTALLFRLLVARVGNAFKHMWFYVCFEIGQENNKNKK